MLTIYAAVISVLLLVLITILAILSLHHRSTTHKFRQIKDRQTYLSQIESKVAQAQNQFRDISNQTVTLNNTLSELRVRVKNFQTAIGKYSSINELDTLIQSRKTSLATMDRDIEEKVAEQKRRVDQEIQNRQREIEEQIKTLGLLSEIASFDMQVREKKRELDRLHTSIEEVEEKGELQSFGFYERIFDFDTSDEFKTELKTVQREQKNMIKSGNAASCDTEWRIDGSVAKGKKMTDKQIKLMLRAFNGETDAAIGKVRYNNINAMNKRIEKSFDQISLLGAENHIVLNRRYLDLRLKELRLSHELELKKQDEKEEQSRIREQMREEERVRKEVEKETKQAEREEKQQLDALEQAKRELSSQTDAQSKETKRLSRLITDLEDKLKEAVERKAKAIARAQLTKTGHVYVLSNIGSFGEGIFKIGMTRRLDPIDRVKELGDASVPFLFDVHAMIHTENAPDLERALHSRFEEKRVNLVNRRKEYFRVSIDEIIEAVNDCHGVITITRSARAEQYRQTLEMERERNLTVSYS